MNGRESIVIDTPEKVQLVCPYCKKEFPFDNGWIDAEYHREKEMFARLSREITSLKSLPFSVQKKKEGEIKTLGLKIQDCQMRLIALKKVRKQKDFQLKVHEMYIYREIIKRELGEEKEKEILAETIKELEAYEAAEFMKRDYSRANSKKSVTSINKL